MSAYIAYPFFHHVAHHLSIVRYSKQKTVFCCDAYLVYKDTFDISQLSQRT